MNVGPGCNVNPQIHVAYARYNPYTIAGRRLVILLLWHATLRHPAGNTLYSPKGSLVCYRTIVLFSTGGAFSSRPRRADLGAARPGRRPQAPGACPRPLTLAPWPARRSSKAENISSVSRGRPGVLSPPLRTLCPRIFFKKTVQHTRKKTHRCSHASAQ